MKILMVVLLAVAAGRAAGQTMMDKTLPYLPGQTIVMRFDYPELITLSTWDKNEISIHASVLINGGENDDAFVLTNNTKDNAVSIRNELKNLDQIPKLITVTEGAKKITFRSTEELKKYENDFGRRFQSKSYGVDMDIKLEIKIPKNVATRIESVYGMVEIKNFNAPLTVESTYGGVDAALRESATGELSAETNYGEIYTNFSARFNGKEADQNFHTYVSAKPGNGPNYNFTSRYGNVYIRKSE